MVVKFHIWFRLLKRQDKQKLKSLLQFYEFDTSDLSLTVQQFLLLIKHKIIQD